MIRNCVPFVFIVNLKIKAVNETIFGNIFQMRSIKCLFFLSLCVHFSIRHRMRHRRLNLKRWVILLSFLNHLESDCVYIISVLKISILSINSFKSRMLLFLSLLFANQYIHIDWERMFTWFVEHFVFVEIYWWHEHRDWHRCKWQKQRSNEFAYSPKKIRRG